MILEKILDLYEYGEEYKRRRQPPSGNPTGSAFGKCAAALQLCRYPEIGQPEGYRPRAVMGFEEGDRVEQWLVETIRRVYPGMTGSAQGLTYFPVPLDSDEVKALVPRIGAPFRDPHRIWGEVRPGFVDPKPRLGTEGKLVTRSLNPKAGFILDPTAHILWAPIYVDLAAKTEDRGHIIVEIKAVSDFAFRRALYGELDYQKRAQAAGIVEATGLGFVWLIYRKNTSHLLEVSYLPDFQGKTRVRLMRSNRQVEEFLVDGPDAVARPDGTTATMLADREWEVGEVWTPHDPLILDEIRARIKRVLLWKPGDEPWREYGPEFTCKHCQGRGRRLCGQCKGRGTTPKTGKPCGPCGGAKEIACDKCEGQGQLARAALGQFPCMYCNVLAACWRPADLEVEVTDKPVGYIRRDAFIASGIQIHTPPSLRTAAAPAPDVPVEQPSLV